MEPHIETLLFPPPNLKRLVCKVRPSKKLLEFCDFAERYVQEGVPGQIPRKFLNHPKSEIVGGLWCDLLVSLSSYEKWTNIPPEENTPEHFPKGLKILIDGSRDRVRDIITLVRNEDWTGYVVKQYEGAFSRCEGSCASQGLGYWLSPGEPRIYTRDQVKAASAWLEREPNVVGVVDYKHVFDVLSKLAVDSSS